MTYLLSLLIGVATAAILVYVFRLGVKDAKHGVTMNALLNQLKHWRNRWRPTELTEDTDKLINKMFANTFAGADGKGVLDYLIETYYQPVEFIGPGDPVRLAERNGQQLMMVDILSRFDRGMHPAAFEPEHSSKDDEPMEVRQ